MHHSRYLFLQNYICGKRGVTADVIAGFVHCKVVHMYLMRDVGVQFVCDENLMFYLLLLMFMYVISDSRYINNYQSLVAVSFCANII